MAYHVFIDNSNLWIEGKYASAVLKGLAKNLDEAHDNKIEDRGWRIDFGKLLRLVTNDDSSNIKTAMIFGSKPPDNDSLWAVAKSFLEPKVHERNFANKEKKVDTEMVTEIVDCFHEVAQEGDIFVIVAGDKDYAPPIKKLKAKGKKILFVVAFWNNVSWEVRNIADKFIDLTENIDAITY